MYVNNRVNLTRKKSFIYNLTKTLLIVEPDRNALRQRKKKVLAACFTKVCSIISSD